MKTKIYLLFLLSFLSSISVMAQKKDKKMVKIELSAKVVDEAGNGLSGVVVSANENADKTVTDENG